MMSITISQGLKERFTRPPGDAVVAAGGALHAARHDAARACSAMFRSA
jgi:hypothetical protein